MPRSPVKLVVSALALVASCTQGGARVGSSSGNAAIAGALEATSLATLRGQGLID